MQEIIQPGHFLNQLGDSRVVVKFEQDLKTCHSEARFIGRGICFFLTAAQQIPNCPLPTDGTFTGFRELECGVRPVCPQVSRRPHVEIIETSLPTIQLPPTVILSAVSDSRSGSLTESKDPYVRHKSGA
jgi:hypothetical protein